MYEASKEAVLNRMHSALARVLVLPQEQEDDEELYDICRAYGLLLGACCRSDSQEHGECSAKVGIAVCYFQGQRKEILSGQANYVCGCVLLCK